MRDQTVTPTGLDFTAYRHAVSQAVVPLDVHSDSRDTFRGDLAAADAGDIHLLGIDADAHAVHRTPALVATSPHQYLKFTVIERGSALVIQDGRENRLQPGDMTVYDTDRPYSLLFDERIQMSVVMFPRMLLDIPTEALERLTATRLDGTSGAGPVVRPFLVSLIRDANGLPGRLTRRLARSAVDMVGALLDAHTPGTDGSGSHDDLMRHILAFIDDHLDVPELSPGDIAAAHFISVRHLHGLFSEQGTTVSTVIRTRRLQCCYDELVNPQHAQRSIASIALSHGFADAAHFSRTFRTHFGVPPSAVRTAVI